MANKVGSSFFNVDFSTKESTLKRIKTIACELATETALKINDNYYTIVDFEFYIHSKEMPDPQTHKKQQQLQRGKLYLHASGIDITFGDGKENYGGILLRSVIKLDNVSLEQPSGVLKEQFEGPQNVATELFSNLNSLLAGEGHNEISLVKHKHIAKKITVLNTKRVGLTPKPSDPEDHYRNLSLRYVAIFPKTENFKQTVKDIETIVREHALNENWDNEKIEKILGYKKSFE